MAQIPTRVLLIEDQEADYLLTRRMLAKCENQVFDLDWADSWQTGIEAIRRCTYDVCLLDFRIGSGDGLELLRESRKVGCNAPIVLLTGINDYRLDLEAMEFGAADFLVKDTLTPELLERSIRYAIAQARAVDELRQRQDQIRASELQFRSVVQSVGDAIILSDANARILFWNKGAETMFGYHEDEIVGQPMDVLMPEQYRASHREGFERYRVTGRSHLVGTTVELQGLRKDGSVFPVELSLAAWTSASSLMLTALVRDITERKRADELRLAKEAAEAANVAKSSFLARMSHELHTPLQAIIGFSNLLMQNTAGNLTVQDLDYLQRILLNAKDQLQLINSILDLSKVEAGRMELQVEPILIDAIVRDVVKQLEPERRSPDVAFILRLPSDIQPISADPHKLKQVLMNIVDNALKFTERGTVTIELIVSPDDMKPIRIDVTDTGVGMQPDKLAQIFEPFRQLEADSSPRVGGSDLGLAICHALCDLMGYRLEVRSQPSQGSTCSVVFGDRSRLPLVA
jgi:PAS domain S-box-containing protein